MTSPFSVDVLDHLDPEHQQLAMARLHFLNFIQELDLTRYRCNCFEGSPTAPVLETGPYPNEQRKIVCGQCGRFIAWLPKLKNKDHRAPSSTGLATSDFCQCCRKTGVNLVGHHVIEVAEGGSNDPKNIWTLCDLCHTVIHTLRRMVDR